ncbi:hypothetical protein CC1G_03527 [Coprinopsis cinerea okayama7|uniref:Uncharacterized protein n=1 Tax=Coprinopsis cinerea (strain Okayama-7 / 130 / ATCC MYA-4618 / FGSC 9003) TaxID=240176 RepID=A8NCG9_COPC7|nr:hypothetical protein CC1G_03527 [Coprinopsis cinerea okayama7\|eukprot:XP_001832513.2 hypothetical protein CC1G_03527 [Coprinopsis cinerea okayama7\
MASQNNDPPPVPPLSRSDTVFSHKGFRVPDPFAPREKPGSSFVHAVLATALFRCWHILVFFGAWSTLITVLNHQGHPLRIETTLLTVLGTVLGFVISYRTTSSFERYNEGRRLWSQIIFASRNFARLVWFFVPDEAGETPEHAQELKARSLVEKKTVINLLEAFAVATKHYLRAEDGIYYEDLYHLVKFLPAYALPPGRPSYSDNIQVDLVPASPHKENDDDTTATANSTSLPLPAQASPASPSSGKARNRKSSFRSGSIKSPNSRVSFHIPEKSRVILPAEEEMYLFPASNPPKYTIFDLFPFSLLIGFFNTRGHDVKGKKAARIRAKMRSKIISQNLPLEISLYLSSYVSALQRRKHCDVPTYNYLHYNLNLLTDSLTGLERILTTPVPFSYSIHLWVTTIVYCLALPFQLWKPLQWVTIPATTIASFIFFGFLVAGEEIENPFGYDKNDLNLDHFTSNIIRNELKAVTSAPLPDPAKWAFHPENNLLFSSSLHDRIPPEDWVARGPAAIGATLGRF